MNRLHLRLLTASTASKFTRDRSRLQSFTTDSFATHNVSRLQAEPEYFSQFMDAKERAAQN